MPSKLKPLMFRLNPQDKARLQAYSARTRISMSAIIYNALMHYLDENESQAERLKRVGELEIDHHPV
jgi:predicted transcriptional regulator